MVSSPKRSAAFFDLDKTVIAKSSTLAFTRPLYQAGLLKRRALLRAGVAQAYYQLFGAGHDQLERARRELGELTKGWEKAEIERLAEETIEEIAAPLVYGEALELIDEHRSEGRRVVVVSSSPIEIVRPLCVYLGIEDVIATEPAIDEHGRYTGEIAVYAYGEGKVELIQRLAKAEKISLPDSYAYSDSATDLPMLLAVGHPVAVNPDRKLRDEAEERGWPILEFVHPVPLPERVNPAAVASGAAIVAGLAAVTAWAIRRSRRSN
jgi:HAD superfamily hydrolase (TIGR01490 family)